MKLAARNNAVSVILDVSRRRASTALRAAVSRGPPPDVTTDYEVDVAVHATLLSGRILTPVKRNRDTRPKQGGNDGIGSDKV